MDFILEGLSLVSRKAIRSMMKDVCGDVSLNVSGRLDEKLAVLQRSALSKDEHPEYDDLYATHQLLQFGMLVWHSGSPACFNRSGISPFLSTVVDWLASRDPDEGKSILLRSSLLGALASVEAATTLPVDKGWSDAAIWEIAMDGGSADLLTAAAFAAYVSTTAKSRRCSVLLQAEAFDYLRDVLLLVLTHHYLGTEEALAVLVCPSICQALLCLITCAGIQAVQYLLTSPWTMNLCAEIRDILKSDDANGDTYRRYLRERASSHMDILLKAIKAALHSDDLDENESSTHMGASRIIHCELASISRLILTVEACVSE